MANKTEIFQTTLERLGSIGYPDNLQLTVGNLLGDKIADENFIAGLKRWLKATPEERAQMPPLFTDQELCHCFYTYWCAERGPHKDDEKRWRISYDLLPQAVRDKAREAFLGTPLPDPQRAEIEKARNETDKRIWAQVGAYLVVQAVHEWKPQ